MGRGKRHQPKPVCPRLSRGKEYVRDCLAAKAQEIEQQRSARADRFLAFARANLAHAPKGWRFNRQRDGERNLEAFG